MNLRLKYTLLVFLLIISSSLFAQDKIWIDANWNLTSAEKAVYYKTNISKEGIVSYFFKNNNKLAKKETYSDGVLEGAFFEYFETGELKNAGKYEEGKKDGVWKTYYKNGKIKTRGKYREGEKVGVWKTFYKNVY